MIKRIYKKVSNFILFEHLSRKIRLFISKVISFFIPRFLLVLSILIVLILSLLGYYRPHYFTKFYNKSISQFFSILKLNNTEFGKINISGNTQIKNEEIIEVIKDSIKSEEGQKPDNEYLLKKITRAIKEHTLWVNDVNVTRSLPDTLNVTISEFKPFAIWEDDKDKYFTDKSGKIVDYEEIEEYKYLIILSGKKANENVESLFNIFAINPRISANIYSATWVSNRRWDIRFENGLLVKLPQENLALAWKSLIKIYNMPGAIIGLELLDLRILDQIYLKYKDSVIKELKTL